MGSGFAHVVLVHVGFAQNILYAAHVCILLRYTGVWGTVKGGGSFMGLLHTLRVFLSRSSTYTIRNTILKYIPGLCEFPHSLAHGLAALVEVVTVGDTVLGFQFHPRRERRERGSTSAW